MTTQDAGFDPVARSRAMIADPGSWPIWPMLPLIRRVGDVTDADYCAFLLDVNRDNWRLVYIGLVYQAREFATLPTRRFESLDALLEIYQVD